MLLSRVARRRNLPVLGVASCLVVLALRDGSLVGERGGGGGGGGNGDVAAPGEGDEGDQGDKRDTSSV